MAEKQAEKQSASLFVVYQSLRDTGTASVYGRYLSRESAQRAVDQAKSGGLSAHREATYLLQEAQADVLGAAPKQETPGELTMNPAGYQVPKTTVLTPPPALTPAEGVPVQDVDTDTTHRSGRKR